jgi:hypothetical protein
MTNLPVVPGGGSPGVAGLVLLVVLLVGVAAGRTKRRWILLFSGLLGVLVLGIAIIALTTPAGTDDPAAKITSLYTVTVPLAVMFTAGWLCGRGSWFRRLVVLGVAVLLLAAFPYAAAGRATADTLFRAPAAAPPGERTPG